MPRDDWAKAKRAEVARRLQRQNDHAASRSKARSLSRKNRHVATNRLQSLQTVLWFGKHKGKSVGHILKADSSYLDFLVRTAETKQQNNWRMDALVQFLAKIISNRHSPRNGQPAPAAVQRGDEAPVTSIEGRGKSVARALGTSAENVVDFTEVFGTLRCANA